MLRERWGLVAQEGPWLHSWETTKSSDMCSDMSAK